MPEPINTEPIALDTELNPAATVELNEQWIAYLEETDIPGSVDGVDPSMNNNDDDNNTAIA